jgi:threonine 3-dehydrogenase
MKESLKKNRTRAVYRNDVPIPSIGDNDVLVQVKATAICGTTIIFYWSPWARQTQTADGLRT